MKILKKYLQNRKGLKKLGTKHVPHTPKGKKKFEANFVTQEEEESLNLDIDIARCKLKKYNNLLKFINTYYICIYSNLQEGATDKTKW